MNKSELKAKITFFKHPNWLGNSMAKDNKTTADDAPATDTSAQPGFAIEKLYVKDVSLEIPNAPQIFIPILPNPCFIESKLYFRR